MSTIPSNSSTGAESGLRVIVVGAGIAGLAAAIALRRQGHIVEIHERSRFSQEFGAGITLTTNVTRLFDIFGFSKENLHPVESQDVALFAFDQESSKPRVTFPASRASDNDKFPGYQVHRVDLHVELKRLALSEEGAGRPCELFLHSPVVDCDPEHGSITLETGELRQADIVVAADGVKSVLRKKVCSDCSDPKLSEFYALRFTIPMDEAFMNDPHVQWTIRGGHSVSIVCDQESRRLVIYPIRDEKVLNVVMLCNVEAATCLKEIDASYNSIVPSERALETFKAFQEKYQYLIKLAAPGSIRAWPLLSVTPSPSTWVKGKTVLIGDAAHPIWPYAGQGGAQGIEDAAALGEVLQKGTSLEQVTSRLHLFETIRRPRCAPMQLTSYAMAEENPLYGGTRRVADHFENALTYDARVAAKEALATCKE